MRLRWLAVGALGVVGCQTMFAPPATPPAAEVGAASRAAPEGPASRAAEVVPASATQPPAAPADADDTLTLAAKCLERGDEPAAAACLEAYVRRHPEQIMFRAHLAELLLKLGRLPDAQGHFEKFADAAREATGAPRRHLVHCHTRLMEIAQRRDDRFGELLHRGIGLLALVAEQDAEPANRDDELCEELVCKAIRALTEAKELRPTDPRVRLALADAHDRAGNRRGADAERAAARNLATPGSLPPADQKRLAWADARE